VDPALYERSAPEHFWRLLIDPPPTPGEWTEATTRAAAVLPNSARAQGDDIRGLLAMTLGEGRFGPHHWKPSTAQRVYYSIKPAIPRALSRRLRRVYGPRRASALSLRWPIEPRYAHFQFLVIRHLLEIKGHATFPFLNFWPARHSYAFVLTHDVETAEGQAFAPAIADLESALGFRSSFNFVPERYRLDWGVIEDLRARGFEIGVHGLRHDGKLFFDRKEFISQASRINDYIRRFGAVGFRAPLMQRQPEWMQILDVEYDSSFFDTDPFEPITGGAMSVWPYWLGSFIELPYTLLQDHTLSSILGESSPRLWFDKLEFLRAMHGMALLCTHPDYLQNPRTWRLYSELLHVMNERADYYHALPMEVARWWRARSCARGVEDLPGGTVARIANVDGAWLPAIESAAPRPARSAAAHDR
jgi:hypothetical protein